MANTAMNTDPLQNLWGMVQELRQEVNGLRSENESLRTTISAVPTLQTNITDVPTTRKSVMSDPFIFEGTKVLFPQWKGQLQEKLDVDGW